MSADLIPLKGGFVTKDPRLDRIPQFDEKSRRFHIRGDPRMAPGKPPRSFTWAINTWLDQGREGRCTEFSLCHDLLARPKVVNQAVVDQILAGKLVYWPSQRDDAWPGGSYPGASPQYEGTSVLAAVSTAVKLGLYAEFRWAFSLEDSCLALGYVGPLLLGINWYPTMSNPDADGWVRVGGDIDGGHAILAYCIHIAWLQKDGGRAWGNVDLDHSWIGLHNSWGPDWGRGGRCRLTLRDFDRLRQEDGEVCIVTQRCNPKSVTALPM